MRVDRPLPRRGIVVTYSGGAATGTKATKRRRGSEIARRLAAVMGFAYEGEYDPLTEYAGRPYFVPHDTLTRDVAWRIGIRGESDLFGAVVPHPFVATKTITHPLVDDRSHAPAGWCTEFARRVADVVLDGFSAFSKDDAVRAGLKCLERGPVRVKPATGIGGLGQLTVDSASKLAEALDAIEPEALARSGVVIEQNLVDVTTYSVGQVRVAGCRRLVPWCAAPDDEQSWAGGLRRVGDHRGARRLRRASGLADVRRPEDRNRAGTHL